MKIKLTSLAVAAILLSSYMAFAQEHDQDKNNEEKFAEHKAQRLKNLNEEKTGIDQVISCVNSAQKQEDMKKCQELQKANMEKRRERNLSQRKERLQNELKKLDEESKNPKK